MKAIIDKDKYKQVKERLPASLKVTHHSYDIRNYPTHIISVKGIFLKDIWMQRWMISEGV